MAKRKWITEDTNWKLFSLVLALVVWLTVHKIRDEPGTPDLLALPDKFSNVPVLAVSATMDVSDASVSPDAVSVTVSGPSDLMAVLQTNRLHAIVNLTGIDSAHDLKRHVDVAMPPGVTLLNVDPPDVTVTILQKK